MRLSVTCFISLANTEEAPLTDNLARLVEIEGKRCTNRRVPYLISAGIFSTPTAGGFQSPPQSLPGKRREYLAQVLIRLQS